MVRAGRIREVRQQRTNGDARPSFFFLSATTTINPFCLFVTCTPFGRVHLLPNVNRTTTVDTRYRLFLLALFPRNPYASPETTRFSHFPRVTRQLRLSFRENDRANHITYLSRNNLLII